MRELSNQSVSQSEFQLEGPMSILTERLLESMENRWSSSGIFSQDLRRWRSSRRPRKTCKIETLSLKILKIESPPCQCSMTSTGQSEEIPKMCQIQKKEKYARGHWTLFGPGDEKKWYGILSYTPGKLDSIAAQMVKRFKENRSPSIQEHQRFESWNSEKKE